MSKYIGTRKIEIFEDFFQMFCLYSFVIEQSGIAVTKLQFPILSRHPQMDSNLAHLLSPESSVSRSPQKQSELLQTLDC